MRIGSALLPGGINWRIRAGDPGSVAVGDGWSVINPLTPLRPQALDTVVLPVESDILLMQHGVLHLVIPDDVTSDFLVERVELALSHLRVLTLDPRGATSVGGCGIEEVAALPNIQHPQVDSKLRVKFFLNRVKTATTLEQMAEAFRLCLGPPPSVHGTLVLDAIAAASHDPRKAILYAAFAVEVLASDASTRVYDAAIDASADTSAKVSDLRIIDRVVSSSNRIRKDPIYERLRAAAKRSFSILLHELPLYLSRRSLLLDDEKLYQSALKLQESRNSIAHSGTMENDRSAFPLTREGSRQALDVARQLFRWFGERDFFVGM